jgi:hypothetical protein
MVIVGISIGMGTVNPRLNRIAKPFIRPHGEMEERIGLLSGRCRKMEKGILLSNFRPI